MIRVPVTSSNISSIGYDEEHKILEIEFQDGGIYQYFAVPEYAYVGLMSTSSHGSYFHRHIKDRYAWRKIR